MVSDHIRADQDRLEIRDLTPGTWFSLLVTAKNDAGITEAKYQFATLTLSGATVQPLLLNSEGNRVSEQLMILVPSICAIVVLLIVTSFAIYLLMAKSHRNPDHSEACKHLDERACNSCNDQPFLSDSGRQAFDSVSLHSYNKTPKNEALYESQRVYCPSLYNTPAIGESLRPGNHQVHSFSGESEYRTVIEKRSLRKGHGFDHLYDVPHRCPKDQSHIFVS